MYSICFIFTYLSNLLTALVKILCWFFAPVHHAVRQRFLDCQKNLIQLNCRLKRNKSQRIVDAQALSKTEYDRLYSRFYPKRATDQFSCYTSMTRFNNSSKRRIRRLNDELDRSYRRRTSLMSTISSFHKY